MFPGDFFSEFNGCKQALFTEPSHQAPVYEPLNSRVESIIINCYGWKICTNFCHFCYFCVCFSTPLGRVTLSCFIWCLPPFCLWESVLLTDLTKGSRGEWGYSGLLPKGVAYIGGEIMRACAQCSSQCTHSQEAEWDERRCSDLFLVFILSVQDLRPWDGAPFIVGLPTSVTLI